MKKLEVVLRALANERRLGILEWLKDPRRHFPPQVDGDLADAGLIRSKRMKQWTFYQRDEKALRRAKAMLARV